MTEPPALPPPDPPAEPAPPPEPPVRRNRLAWMTGLGFLVLALGLLLVWRYPTVPPPDTERIEALARQLSALDARLARVEQRPTPAAPDLAPLVARVTALEQRPAPVPAAAAGAAPDLAPLEARVAALEQRPAAPTAGATVDLGPLEGRLAALERRPVANLAPLETRVAALEQRPIPNLAPLEAKLAALENAERAADAETAQRLDAAANRATAGEQRTARATQVLAAALALAAGQKLGPVPGAPPALARFADAPPPSEAALRAAFPRAAREALAAAHPGTDGKPLLTRLWAQAQELVTIRQGEHVLVGDPTAGTLERARVALDSGDLAGAVSELASLQGSAAQAMAGWMAQARSLLDAKAALAAWAAAG